MIKNELGKLKIYVKNLDDDYKSLIKKVISKEFNINENEISIESNFKLIESGFSSDAIGKNVEIDKCKSSKKEFIEMINETARKFKKEGFGKSKFKAADVGDLTFLKPIEDKNDN
jgi:hypothetical protein